MINFKSAYSQFHKLMTEWCGVKYIKKIVCDALSMKHIMVVINRNQTLTSFVNVNQCSSFLFNFFDGKKCIWW